jgi:hypothetical protein
MALSRQASESKEGAEGRKVTDSVTSEHPELSAIVPLGLGVPGELRVEMQSTEDMDLDLDSCHLSRQAK